MERSFISHLVTGFGNMVDRTWGFMKVYVSFFIGIVLTVLMLKLFGNNRPSLEFFALLTAIFSIIAYIVISYTFKKLKI